jgi:uncharacterized protein YjiS (DUF1127 family)
MTTWFGTALPGALADRRAESETVRVAAAIASRWTEVRSVWMRRLARHRFRQSIAHLDDRLLADIGLGPQHLGFAERVARYQAAQAGIRRRGKEDA